MKNPDTVINKHAYRLLRFAAGVLSSSVFHVRVTKNDLIDARRPFVVLANHQCSMDPCVLINASPVPLHFVISRAYYTTLPFGGFLDSLGMLPKQQFQTSPSDLRRMKELILSGENLVLYPAGLMCEDGLSTPLPRGTGKFLRFLDTDVYFAKCHGNYFVKPKWGKGLRPGKTFLEIVRLFSREELRDIPQKRLDAALQSVLSFDAYLEQEEFRTRYRHGDRIRGLQTVLTVCPSCLSHHSLEEMDRRTLRCRACRFTVQMDKTGFLQSPDPSFTFRHASSWSRWIDSLLEESITDDFRMEIPCRITRLSKEKRAFLPVGSGTVTLTKDELSLRISDTDKEEIRSKSPGEIPILPFMPGKNFDFQDGPDSFRCFPEDPRIVTEFIKSLKILHKRSLQKQHD